MARSGPGWSPADTTGPGPPPASKGSRLRAKSSPRRIQIFFTVLPPLCPIIHPLGRKHKEKLPPREPQAVIPPLAPPLANQVISTSPLFPRGAVLPGTSHSLCDASAFQSPCSAFCREGSKEKAAPLGRSFLSLLLFGSVLTPPGCRRRAGRGTASPGPPEPSGRPLPAPCCRRSRTPRSPSPSHHGPPRPPWPRIIPLICRTGPSRMVSSNLFCSREATRRRSPFSRAASIRGVP